MRWQQLCISDDNVAAFPHTIPDTRRAATGYQCLGLRGVIRGTYIQFGRGGEEEISQHQHHPEDDPHAGPQVRQLLVT